MRLDFVTRLVLALLVELWSAAGAVLVHLFLHTMQTLVKMVPLQQTGQLILGKLSRVLRESEEGVNDERKKCVFIAMRA